MDQAGITAGGYWGIGGLFTGLQILLAIVAGTVEAVHGTITLGDFLAFVPCNATLVWPVRGLGRILSVMGKPVLREIGFTIPAGSTFYNMTPVGILVGPRDERCRTHCRLGAWGLVVSYVLGVFVAMLLLSVRLALLVIVVVPVLSILTVYLQIMGCFWRL